ncbi:MAG: 50S ribosomal protein L6 [Candidatus Nanoarchaeia archaeon]|nr:50S ribosomal protein L6 [Candidatus Nanoarchaeia archaeon]MDD5239655.1 50S ribosomal protein L6 [Candidatus Nanoarchaeia archaeon]
MKDIIKIPDGAKVELLHNDVKVSGKLGEIKRTFIEPDVKKEIQGGEIILSTVKESRKAKRIIKSYKSIIKSMLIGVIKGYEYKMKIIFTHFPTTAKVEGTKLRIDNFLGERAPRYAKILPGVEIKINKQELVLTGADLCAVSQTAGNIEQTTRVVGKDRRVFQDGIYITEKAL